MVGRFVIILWLCWCVCRFGLVDCQVRQYAPRNVTATPDATAIRITWLIPQAPQEITKFLKAFRVRLVPVNEPQLSHDHWVPRSAGDSKYGHKVTCLSPATKFQVSVLAVYDSASNISEADARFDMGVRATLALDTSWWSKLWERPLPIVVGAALMLLIVLIVLPLLCFILYKRRSRRKLRLGSSHGLGGAGQKQSYCKTSSTPSTPLPSTQYLHDMERGNNYHLTPVAAPPSSSSSSRPAPARAIPASRAAANQRSPLIQYSPPSGYQASSSVPSQVAPQRPGEDLYELEEEEDYENVLVVNAPIHVHVKSTSFSGVSRPVRGGGGAKVPVSINEDEDDEDDEDGGTYMNNVFGRRCVTMPSKAKCGKVATGFQKEASVYGNCKF